MKILSQIRKGNKKLYRRTLMKSTFKFYPNESKIYDYLFLPSMIYYNEEKEALKHNYNEHISEDFKLLCSSISTRLKSYKKVILKYYFEEVNLVFLLSCGHSFFSFSSVDDYLDYLLKLDDQEILKNIIYGLHLMESDGIDNQEAKTLAESLIKDEEELISWINTLNYSGNTKWQLLCFSKAPKNNLQECIQLLKDLKPLFNEFYEQHEESIHVNGDEFINRLNSIEGDSLSQVTNGVLKDSSIPGETKNIIISYFDSYTIQIHSVFTPNFVAWGIMLEKLFEQLIEQSENELLERILLFKNLGDKTRYEVLKCIAKGITSTKIIAEQLGVSSATISYHLSNLATCKLITLLRQEGRYHYAVNHDFIDQCFTDLKKDL